MSYHRSNDKCLWSAITLRSRRFQELFAATLRQACTVSATWVNDVRGVDKTVMEKSAESRANEVTQCCVEASCRGMLASNDPL